MGATYTNLLYHLVFSTKDRAAIITPELTSQMYKYIGGIIRNEGGTQLIIGGTTDHIHILTKLKADRSLSDVLRTIKANASRWANEQGRSKFAWQTGYAAFTVSESQVGKVKKYIAGQVEHHRRRSFKEELVAMLDRHGIEYDKRHIWA